MADNDFNWWSAVPVVGGLLGGLFGSQSGQPTTQTVQYLPPQYSPQQQAINNIMYYGIMQNLMQQQPQYQNLLNQYIYGTPGGGIGGMEGMAPTGGLPTAQQAIEQYRTQKEMVTEAERPMKELTRDLRIELLAPVYKAAQNAAMNLQDPTKSNEYNKAMATAKEELNVLAGMNADEVENWISATTKKGVQDIEPQIPKSFRKTMYYITQTGKEIPEKITGKYPEIQNVLQSADFSQVAKGITQPQPAIQPEVPIAPTGEMQTAEGAVSPVTGEATTPAGGILGQLMQSPQYLTEQFTLAKEQGMKDISDWYQQAQRELEQRGIAQGGYLGSQYERDVGGILGRRGEMETQLGSSLRQAEIAATRQNWYDMLNALSNLQTLQGNLQAQQTAPWLGAAQQMTNVQPGYTTTQSSPGVGIFPGMIAGGYAGAGLAKGLSNFGGIQNQPATSYGAGLMTPGLSLTGTQNLWNKYIANPWG